MNFVKKILLGGICLTICINFGFGQEAKTDSKSILEQYYESSKNGNVAEIMKTIDQDFYKAVSPKGFSYEEYLTEFYKNFKILDYNISNFSYIENSDFDLVFYTIEGQGQVIDNGETIDIVNNMVALLVKKGATYKVAWTMNKELYDYKILANGINDVVMELTMDDLDELDLKKHFEDKGLVRLENTSIKDIDNTDGLYTTQEIQQAENIWEQDNNLEDTSSSSSTNNSTKFSKKGFDARQKRFGLDDDSINNKRIDSHYFCIPCNCVCS